MTKQKHLKQREVFAGPSCLHDWPNEGHVGGDQLGSRLHVSLDVGCLVEQVDYFERVLHRILLQTILAPAGGFGSPTVW